MTEKGPAQCVAESKKRNVSGLLSSGWLEAIAWEPVLQFVFFLVLYLLGAAFFTFGMKIYMGDAIARTASAFFTIFSRDPHLAAIGFVWNPLPSLVQIPFLLLLKPLGASVFAGGIMSSMFGAASCVILGRFLQACGIVRAQRCLLIGLYGLNPMIYLYSINGMSDVPFIFFVFLAAYGFVSWARSGRNMDVMIMAAAMAGAFLVRYEAVPLAAAGVVALVLVMFRRGLERAEGILLAYLSPLAYVVLLWVYFNWLIMHDPLFFQRSAYSNLAQTVQFRTTLTHLTPAYKSIIGALVYSVPRTLIQFPIFALIFPLAILQGLARKDMALLGLAAMSLAVPVFQLYLLYSGSSYGWLRFFMYGIPASFLLLGRVGERVLEGKQRWAWLMVVFLILVLSNLATVWTMNRPNYGLEEFSFLQKVRDPGARIPSALAFPEEKAIARYLHERPEVRPTLMDTFLGFAIVLFSDDPHRFIISSDRDFEHILAAPQGMANYLLVPSPVGQFGQTDKINSRYPQLYEHGAAWAVLEKDFGGDSGWRLYRVLPP